jgi:hypothetical protein
MAFRLTVATAKQCCILSFFVIVGTDYKSAISVFYSPIASPVRYRSVLVSPSYDFSNKVKRLSKNLKSMFRACPELSRRLVKKIYTMNYTQLVNNNKTIIL